MSLTDYLNAKYLTKDDSFDKKAKKRKRKEEEKSRAKAAGRAITLVDEDALGWENSRDNDDDEDDRPVTVNDRSTSEFRKSKKSAWNTISDPKSTNTKEQDEETAAADAIIASTAADIRRSEAALLESEAPVLVTDGQDQDAMIMESGARAGLQTAAQVAAAMKIKKAKELRDLTDTNAEAAAAGSTKHTETIYRDASGRIVNVALQRAEARKKHLEEQEKKEKQKEMNKGVVQIVAQEERRQQLEEAKFMKLARKADDEDMNRELKEKERWGDTGLQFVKKTTGGVGKSGLPLFKGAFAPNRYGIPPGHRWDGVDRGNGTEALFFRKRNEKIGRAQQEYAWEMDV